MIRKRIDHSISKTFLDIKADYAAAQDSRFRRTRTNLNGTGDDHLGPESKFFRVIEYCRDMDRNDSIVGSLIDRSLDNTIQGGFKINPDTGDKTLNADIKGLFLDWAKEPDLCDTQGEFNFWQIERMVSRGALIDGDSIVGGLQGNKLQMIEADRVRTPRSVRNDRRLNSQVIHGVEMNKSRRRLRYWITNNQSRTQPKNLNDMERWPVRDSNGKRQVFHVFDPKRSTQARGVSALVPVFDLMGMFEDLQFAKVVQAQVVSCMAIFLESDVEGPINTGKPQIGAQEEITRVDGTTAIEEEISPGMIRSLPRGVKASGFSPSVPNAEFFPHVRLILQLIGLNIGLPLVQVLMDASETNFSGWRGAVDEARRGFRRLQQMRILQFHTPVYQWRLRKFIADKKNTALRSAFARLKGGIFKHEWGVPGWPYIQPEKDSKANKVRIDSLQTSPRRLQDEIGNEYDVIQREIVEDNALIIRTAIMAKQKLKIDFPDEDIDYRDLINLNFSKPTETENQTEELQNAQ